MAKLSLLSEVAADPRLADHPPEYQCVPRAFGPSDMLFSSGQGVSGLLPPVRPIRVRVVCCAVGRGWILVWPTSVAAIPAVIFLHVKYRKAPRSCLIPRSGWRFWAAYVGLVWVPLLLTISFLTTSIAGRR